MIHFNLLGYLLQFLLFYLNIFMMIEIYLIFCDISGLHLPVNNKWKHLKCIYFMIIYIISFITWVDEDLEFWSLFSC